MTVNQIYNIVNTAQRVGLGQLSVDVVDTTSFVALGDLVLSSSQNVDAFFGVMPDIIGRYIFAVRDYQPVDRFLRRDNMEFGAALAKVKIKTLSDAVEDAKWDNTKQASPFDIEKKSRFAVKLYGGSIAPWTFEDVIPRDQIFSAFNSEAQMDGFLGMIYTNMRNKMNLASENLDKLTIATGIAAAFATGKAAQKRNLLKEYNTLTGQSLTLAQARRDIGYLTYRVQQMDIVRRYMHEMYAGFNAEDGIANFSTDDRCVFEITTQAASDIKYNLRNNTYHDNFESLELYGEVNSWMGLGDLSYEGTSKVTITNESLNGGDTVEVKNVFAVIRDVDAAGTLFDKPQTWSMYNPRADVLNYGMKAVRNYYVDPSENFVIFYDDPDEE